ncbi:MAG TPA: FtsQ-type POTRA domain-containing protein [Pyrinomonadaceae bacterium]|nr:FtsQ-type POTRA domain-containing protein [Pyrinomonadaceae bacterium]
MREQVITPRAGRVGAGAKGRGAVSVQRPNTRRAKPAQKDSRQKSFAWKSVLPYVPAALKVVLAVALGLLAYLGYRTAVSASFFKVRSVDVAGATRASREDIQAAVRRLSNAGVWQADLEVISNELKTLPWVRDAVVTRVLPGGLRVRVTEREPRVIARTSAGKLVWVDDDGVSLGVASPGDGDFFVRGIEESRADDVVKRNRERVQAALELSRDWAAAGLSRRVSEVNLDDLRDVRVQLSGNDADVEVRLGKEELVKRFRQALEVLDAQRSTPRGPYVTYVDVSQGKRAVVGTGSTAHFQPGDSASSNASEPQTTESAHNATAQDATRTARPANKEEKKAAATRQPLKASKPDEKKKSAQQPSAAAVRPRRVE